MCFFFFLFAFLSAFYINKTLDSKDWSFIIVRGVCNLLSSVLPQQKFEMVDQCYSSVLLGKQREIHPQGMRVGQPERV